MTEDAEKLVGHAVEPDTMARLGEAYDAAEAEVSRLRQALADAEDHLSMINAAIVRRLGGEIVDDEQ